MPATIGKWRNAVGVARELVLLAGRAPPRTRRRTASHDDHVEVEPPERGRRSPSRAWRRSTTPRSTTSLGAHADRDDRLAERDDHDQPVALGEMCWHQLPALGAEQERAAHVERERDHPERALHPSRRPSDAASSRPTPIAVLAPRPVTERRRAGSSRLAITNSPMWARRTTPYVQANAKRVVAEGARARKRGDEERGHRGEHRESDGALLGVDDARQPRIAGP